MDTGATINAAANKRQLPVKGVDDACQLDVTKTVPLTNNDGSYTTESFSAVWVGEIREVCFTDLKQEHYDVCYVL